MILFLIGFACGYIGLWCVLSLCRSAGRADECAECLRRRAEILNVTTASVKVMRSHDYCHFECQLGAAINAEPDSHLWIDSVDELRKNAARLVDYAVEQYIQAKNHRCFGESYTVGQAQEVVLRLREKPEHELTVEEKARLKDAKDLLWRADREYDYQDDWNQDEDAP